VSVLNQLVQNAWRLFSMSKLAMLRPGVDDTDWDVNLVLIVCLVPTQLPEVGVGKRSDGRTPSYTAQL
jgi:hypothetical protein